MSTRTHFPLLPLLAIGAIFTASAAARAEDMVLAGPHPFLKENAIAVQFLVGNGLGDSFSGRGVGLGYGYMLQGPLWLDLQMNVRASGCGPFSSSCGAHTGNAAELMTGIAWRFRTDIPVVPFLRGGAGVVYLYPDGAQSAFGLAARGGTGLKYYVFDWLGFGVEAALSLGHGYFAPTYSAGRGYAVFDMAVGVEYQFR